MLTFLVQCVCTCFSHILIFVNLLQCVKNVPYETFLIYYVVYEWLGLPSEQAVERIRELIHTLSPTRVIVMRYLFSFLNHLSQYSDENLMYPYNLAICFGPTLLPIPHDKDQVC